MAAREGAYAIGQCGGALVLFLALGWLTGCTAGRYAATDGGVWLGPRDARYRDELAGLLGAPAPASCDRGAPEDPADLRNTVFVHPGLLLSARDWDFSLAGDAGLLLVQEGLAGAVLELRERTGARMQQRMLEDPGTRFVGLHYSMGGRPALVQSGVLAARRASLARGRPLRYSPLLVDPVDTESFGEALDMDDPRLGEVFIVVSRDFAYLRPDIKSASRALLAHPKTHVLYAEDYGARWGHFGFFTDATGAAGASGAAAGRAGELLRFIVRASARGADGAAVEAGLAYYKVKYAAEDGRPVAARWLEQARSLACRPAPEGRQALMRSRRF
jgi:hypothetical protein